MLDWGIKLIHRSMLIWWRSVSQQNMWYRRWWRFIKKYLGLFSRSRTNGFGGCVELTMKIDGTKTWKVIVFIRRKANFRAFSSWIFILVRVNTLMLVVRISRIHRLLTAIMLYWSNLHLTCSYLWHAWSATSLLQLLKYLQQFLMTMLTLYSMSLDTSFTWCAMISEFAPLDRSVKKLTLLKLHHK